MQSKRKIEIPSKQRRVEIVASSTETDGEYTLLRVELGPGGAAQPHFHRLRDEHFMAIKGQLDLLVGGERISLNPGESLTAPRETLHGFQNRTDDWICFEVKISPGHLEWENMMRIDAGLEHDRRHNKPLPSRFLTTCLLAEWSEVYLPGPVFSLVAPVLRWGARRARAKGLDSELITRFGGERPAET